MGNIPKPFCPVSSKKLSNSKIKGGKVSSPLGAALYPHLTPWVSGTGIRGQEGIGIKLAYTRKRFMFEKSVHFYSGVQALQSPPDALRAWHSVSLTPQMSADDADHPYRLLQCRRLFRRFCLFGIVTTKRLPLYLLEKHRTRMIRHFPPQHRQMIDTLCNHHIHPKTCFKPIRSPQLAIFYSTSRFQSPMIYLDPTTPRIPLYPMFRFLEAVDLSRCRKHPLNRSFSILSFAFKSVDSPNLDRRVVFVFWRRQTHLRKTNVNDSLSCSALFASWYSHLQCSGDFLAAHKLPKMLLLHFACTALFRAHQQRYTGAFRLFKKKLVNVGLAIPYAHQHSLRAKPLDFRHLAETPQPFHALFLLYRRLCTRLLTQSNSRFLREYITPLLAKGMYKYNFLHSVSSSCSMTDFNPIGRLVTTSRIDKCLHQHGTDMIAGVSILRQTPKRQGQYMRGQIRYMHSRHDQKPAIGNHIAQIHNAGCFIPADLLVSRLQRPRCGTEGQRPKIPMRGTLDDIADLGAAECAASKVMMLIQQSPPDTRIANSINIFTSGVKCVLWSALGGRG